jgi:hypothetical protein
MTHKICDSCETVVHCSKHGCVPLQSHTTSETKMTPQKRLQQLAAAEAHHDSKGYSLGTREGYEAAVAERNQSSGPPPPTYEEALHELWYLRRRVKQLEKQVFEMGWQISGESMGR